jgi:hypothetical protein
MICDITYPDASGAIFRYPIVFDPAGGILFKKCDDPFDIWFPSGQIFKTDASFTVLTDIDIV